LIGIFEHHVSVYPGFGRQLDRLGGNGNNIPAAEEESPPRTVSLQVNFFSRSSNIRPPMMLIDGIFLVQVDLEELVMSIALEVLVSSL
jgi:hypothetical protein